jgi:uncharacterized protein with HEPN domain
MRSDVERLRDIYEAILQIERYTVQGERAFRQEELIQTWVVYHLQVIGEAARAISDGFQERYAQVPWSDVVGLRNVLVHQYFRIDEDIVWSIVNNDLPSLKSALNKILQDFVGTDDQS